MLSGYDFSNCDVPVPFFFKVDVKVLQIIP